jgi:hypothetical protein
MGLAVPGGRRKQCFGGSAWPGGSKGLMSNRQFLVMWFGYYTFIGKGIGPRVLK